MPASTVNSPGLTAEQVQAILVQPLMAAGVFLTAGPRIFDTNGSPDRIPKLVSMTPLLCGREHLASRSGRRLRSSHPVAFHHEVSEEPDPLQQ